ncbi:MAG: 1,4-dihydroxy-2-naphthoate octaprenyltransferase [Crocinitomicaceae bacterium]|nr:1,4-dihydroxy-2-naphthoate octaprenyltransferase [Crocinitomicaceae bacterium]
MSQPKAWINAMRLRTLPLSLSGIIMGSAVAYYQGYWDWLIFSLAIATTILFQIVSNLANDLGDGLKGTDNENRVGPERMVQSGAISPKQMKFAVILTSILSFSAAGILIYFGAQNMPSSVVWFYAVLAILCVIAAITYTVGKRAYGYHGMGDLMVLIFFGFVSVLGVYSLYSKEFVLDMVLPAITIGLLSTAVLNLNNMRDYSNDAKSGKNTLVVKMGPNMAKLYHALLIIIALSSLGVFVSLFKQPILFIGMLPAVMLLIHLRKVMATTDTKKFDPELKVVALSTFAISIFMFAMLIYLKPV